jgi:hypothetical protein
MTVSYSHLVIVPTCAVPAGARQGCLPRVRARDSRYDRGAGTDVNVVLSAAVGVLRDHGSRLDP